ncbi:MAG: DUF3185 family protein [Planctomycetota bacterium]
MSKRKLLGAALVLGGVVLLVYGFRAKDSFASEVKEAIDGTPTDEAVWYLASGAVAVLAGLGLAMTGGRK